MRPARGEREKDAVFLEDEPFPAGELVVFLAQRIGDKPRAIGFVGGEVLDVVDAIGRRRRPFMRRVVADQVGAAARDRR